ncbi:MAG: HAD-IB family phosphatase [Chloroflexi bacterium]|nr:HAD-IB family phosphatase [Chloroflexota bacterium]
MAIEFEGRRVFVSSTFKDLKRHREAARDAIRRLDGIDIAMEDFGARETRPRDASLKVLREKSDVFVGVYAYRYGTVPAGDERSITEQEFDEARRLKLPMYAYSVDRHHSWPERLRETGAAAERLAAFKARLTNDVAPWPFTTPKDLAASVAGDLGRYFANPAGEKLVERGLIHGPPPEWVSQARANRGRYKVVAFDLDGTLFRGQNFVFSWELIWSDLGFGSQIQSDLKRTYLRRSSTASTKAERIDAYEEWCDEAVKGFKARGLTRERLRTLSESIRLTRNARAALRRLRDAGVSTALISGGVDTFLADAFPDYRDVFDFVFINELTFDGAGVIDGVRATAYDFEGKFDALKRVCERVGCTIDEAVFVGDQINDRHVLLQAGLGIAYPSTAQVVSEAAVIRLARDDLNAILPHVLVE